MLKFDVQFKMKLLLKSEIWSDYLINFLNIITRSGTLLIVSYICLILENLTLG